MVKRSMFSFQVFYVLYLYLFFMRASIQTTEDNCGH